MSPDRRPTHPPRAYHITHVDNLASIVAGGLWSDAVMAGQGGPRVSIGADSIKQRRTRLAVGCHPGDVVAEYVPFYLCPRSVMRYVLHRANLPGVTYRGGQAHILHLELDLAEVVADAEADGRRWAVSRGNAAARYARFHADLEALDTLDWAAIHASDFRDREVKEQKQSELLIRDRVPWRLVRRVGAASSPIAARAEAVIRHAEHRPPVEVVPEWYF